MEGNKKATSEASWAVETIEVRPSSDRTHLVGDCPMCGRQLRIDAGRDASPRGMVACLRCHELYRIQDDPAALVRSTDATGFGVSYVVEGPWDPPAILEHLFDTVGTVEYVPGGFVCYPDEHEARLPTILIDEDSRIIRLGLFTPDSESEAAVIINQAISELASRFQLVLAPLALDRWAYREDQPGLTLIEHRPLGVFMKDPPRCQAHA